MSSTFGSDLWSEGFKLVSSCPVCEVRYSTTQARVLGQHNQTQLIHVRCQRCQHAVLALVLVNQAGASSVGLLTDLSYEDAQAFHQGATVSVDDVIDVHTWVSSDTWLNSLEQQVPLQKKLKRTLVSTKRKKKANTAQ